MRKRGMTKDGKASGSARNIQNFNEFHAFGSAMQCVANLAA